MIQKEFQIQRYYKKISIRIYDGKMNIHLPELKATNKMAIKSNQTVNQQNHFQQSWRLTCVGTVGDEGHMIHDGTPNANSWE